MSNENTTVVILGGTGDLAKRKLVPALFNLNSKGRIPPDLRIVCYARRDYTDDVYREFMWEGTREFGDLTVNRDEWEVAYSPTNVCCFNVFGARGYAISLGRFSCANQPIIAE